jgi:hypothetical protein
MVCPVKLARPLSIIHDGMTMAKKFSAWFKMEQLRFVPGRHFIQVITRRHYLIGLCVRANWNSGLEGEHLAVGSLRILVLDKKQRA